MTRHLPSAGVLLVAVLATACGGGDNGAGNADDDSITPATPPSDVCSMLTLSDVQGLFPGATTNEEVQMKRLTTGRTELTEPTACGLSTAPTPST